MLQMESNISVSKKNSQIYYIDLIALKYKTKCFLKFNIPVVDGVDTVVITVVKVCVTEGVGPLGVTDGVTEGVGPLGVTDGVTEGVVPLGVTDVVTDGVGPLGVTDGVTEGVGPLGVTEGVSLGVGKVEVTTVDEGDVCGCTVVVPVEEIFFHYCHHKNFAKFCKS